MAMRDHSLQITPLSGTGYTRFFYDGRGYTYHPVYGVDRSKFTGPAQIAGSGGLVGEMVGGVISVIPGVRVDSLVPGAFSARDQKPAPRPLVRPEAAGSITPTGELDLNSMRGQISNEVREVVNWIKSFSISAECNDDGTITVRLRMPDFEG